MTRSWWIVAALCGAATGCGQTAAVERPAAGTTDKPADAATGDAARGKHADHGEAKMQTASFAAGCFWGVEAAFQQVPGVADTTVGYCGGHTENPNYQSVCTDRTGHAETVLVKFDPAQVSYERLLDVFWSIHDPTTRNRQGPDVGSQYRSVVFYYTAEQKAAAEAAVKRLQQSGKFRGPIVTEIVPAATFWPAEEYHQRYFEKHGGASCHVPGLSGTK